MNGIGTAVVILAVEAAWALGSEAPITHQGWGSVQVGMRVTKLRAEGFRLSSRYTEEDDCVYLHSPNAPDLRVMAEGGRVVRVETDQPRYSTDRGVRVGDTLARARRVYSGRIVARPHKYVGNGEYLIVYTSDRKRAVLIEVVEGKVVQIRGGVLPAVEYVEGCS